MGAYLGRSMTDDLNLALLTTEPRALEAGTFEIGDHAETSDLMSL